jgi:hypothetical protein
MKKIVLGFITILFALTDVSAQTFQLAPTDSAKTVVADNGGKAITYIDNKTTSPITISWKVLSTNIMSSHGKWYTSFGICDNNLCYGSELINSPYPTKTTLPIAASATHVPFYMQFQNLSGVTTYGPYYTTVELTDGTTTDTVTLVASKWTTSINTTAVKGGDNVIIYPNPAREEVNVVFNGMPEVKTIGIYNMIGKMVSIYKVSGTSAQMQMDSMPTGMYLIRLMDGQGHVVATRKFTHQD